MAALEATHELAPHADWRERLPRLGNDRVVLRELQRTDAPALHRLACAPDIAAHTWPPPPTVEAFRRFIERTWTKRADGRYICFGIVPRGMTNAAGLFELRSAQPDFFRAELGFLLDPVLWGTGLFSNASHLLFNFVFDVLCVHRIEARASVDNARSNAALKRIGARHEGVLHAAFARKGKFVDQNLWAIVATLHQRSQPARRNRRSTVGTAGH